MRWFPQWWREHFLGAEFGVALVATGGLVLWVEEYGGAEVVERLLRQNRGLVYGTLASIFGSLLGFVITTVSIVMAFSTSERLAPVRDSRHYPTLWRVFISTIRILGLAVLAALGGLLIDRDGAANRPVFYVCVLLSLLAAIRLGRCVWVLENMIDVVTGGVRRRKSGTAP